MKKLLITSFVIFAYSLNAESLLRQDPIDFSQEGDISLPTQLKPNANYQKMPMISMALPIDSQIQSAILQQQWALLPRLLRQYQQQGHYDPALYHYALAAYYFNTLQYDKAILHYQTLLDLHPEVIYPRFDMAVIFFENYQYLQAKQQFERLMLKADGKLKTLIEAYLQEIEHRQQWQPYVNFQYVKTDNVNNASSEREITINGKPLVKDEESLPQSAQGVRYAFELERIKNITGNHFWQTTLGYNGVYYWDNQYYNEQTLHFSLGYMWRDAQFIGKIIPFVEQNWFGVHRYNHQFGVKLFSQIQLSEHWLWQNRLANMRKHYADTSLADRYNGNENTVSTTIIWQDNTHWQSWLNLELVSDRLKEKSSSSLKWASGFGITYYQKQWGTQINVRYIDRHFADHHYLMHLKRHDREYQLNGTIWYQKLSWKGFLPQLHIRYQRINSNIPAFYSRKNQELFFTIEKQF
ncbi:surface lipoprotein assembly modifier [Gallibacterium anatis]|uniref:surface lipoprotein assembly modifier n=1 Tax=Gallibacterium anatis TaxID=750 RepID=UPI003003FCC2